MRIHEDESVLSQTIVRLMDGQQFRVDDWWDRIQDTPWRESSHELAIEYASRRQRYNLPVDDNVLYGWIDGVGECLVNSCEIDDFQ